MSGRDTWVTVLGPGSYGRNDACDAEIDQRDHCAANSVKAQDRAVVRSGAIAEVEHHLVDVTPPPAFGRVIAFDDWMARLVKVLGGMAVRRIVATADMAAGPA